MTRTRLVVSASVVTLLLSGPTPAQGPHSDTVIAVVDMNGDKRPDVLTDARKGADIFFNGGKSTQMTSTR
jgi:hypothetical protein